MSTRKTCMSTRKIWIGPENGLPRLGTVERLKKTPETGSRVWLYVCLGCGLGRRMASRDGAFGLSWGHSEDFPCDAIEDPQPPTAAEIVRIPCAEKPAVSPNLEPSETPSLFDELK